MSKIQYQFFPKSSGVPNSLLKVVDIFKQKESQITSLKYQLPSNDVLGIISEDIEKLGYRVEKSKRAEDKIQVPVLFGRNGLLEKYFEADGYNQLEQTVIEVEAGRAVTNYQFLKDIFQACVMHDVLYLVVAVRNIYRNQKDFDMVISFLD